MNAYTDLFSFVGANLQGSEIRRLFATSMQPDIISFAGGLPDPGSFPAQEVAEAVNKLLQQRGDLYLQYGPSSGTREGIDAAIHRMKNRSIHAEPAQIIMTSGSQQAIDIMTMIFIDPGDVILVEEPTFVGALGTFRNSQARIIGVPMDEQGIDITILKQTLQNAKQENHRVKFLYLIPNFQNPTGLTMSQERRVSVLQIAKEYDFMILEDDPYGELVFNGDLNSVRPLKAQDAEDRVIYTSSFSKIISPGIRLGWVLTAPHIIERFDMAKQMLDVCSNPLMQGLAWELCNSGFLDSHVTQLRRIYKSRADVMLAALQRYMPEGVSWTKPAGGFFIWLTLPRQINALEMLNTALAHNVAYVIGSAFSANSAGENTMRISFCHEQEEIIEKGVYRLAETIKDFISREG
ncbi:MAG TPA: PLP-dependent aminotransferase family protein [bacterium]|nr:PLP-dependent aminotransferase family protein [bacterium]HPN44047.1 PLP-dependent aminotransferase family protein [bacterium]